MLLLFNQWCEPHDACAGGPEPPAGDPFVALKDQNLASTFAMLKNRKNAKVVRFGESEITGDFTAVVDEFGEND